MTTAAVGSVAKKVPGVKRIPVLKLLALADIAILAHDHASRLDRSEQRRLLELVRRGHGRSANLDDRERAELRTLIAKAEPRRFAGLAADRLSPVPLPKRIVNGPRR